MRFLKSMMLLFLLSMATLTVYGQDLQVLQKRVESLEARVGYLENQISTMSQDIELLKKGSGGVTSPSAAIKTDDYKGREAGNVESLTTTPIRSREREMSRDEEAKLKKSLEESGNLKEKIEERDKYINEIMEE